MLNHPCPTSGCCWTINFFVRFMFVTESERFQCDRVTSSLYYNCSVVTSTIEYRPRHYYDIIILSSNSQIISNKLFLCKILFVTPSKRFQCDRVTSSLYYNCSVVTSTIEFRPSRYYDNIILSSNSKIIFE